MEAADTGGAVVKVDKDRIGGFGNTGIYVRAKNRMDKWDSVDIADLDRDSLHTWLKSRGGDNLWAENVVMILLGHPPLSEPSTSIETSSTQPTALTLPVAWSVGHPITVHNTGTADLNIYANCSITLKPGETWTSPKEIR
jgi:hypothetical protein